MIWEIESKEIPVGRIVQYYTALSSAMRYNINPAVPAMAG